MKKLKHILAVLTVSLTFWTSFAQTETAPQTGLENKLKELFPDAAITKTKDLDGFSESYQLVLNEPLDHNNPKKGTFKHYVYLSHLDFKSPMVIETEGYAARYKKTELSSLLHTNQVIVEYRFSRLIRICRVFLPTHKNRRPQKNASIILKKYEIFDPPYQSYSPSLPRLIDSLNDWSKSVLDYSD